MDSPEGIAIEAKDVPDARDTIADWLAGIGISGTVTSDLSAFDGLDSRETITFSIAQ